VEEAAACPLFLLSKRVRHLYPRLDYSPSRPEPRPGASNRIRRAQDQRGGRGLIFAPHVSGAPHEILGKRSGGAGRGANGRDVQRSFALGTVRMVREATRLRPATGHLWTQCGDRGQNTRRHLAGGHRFCSPASMASIFGDRSGPRGPPFIYPHGAEWECQRTRLDQPLPASGPP
jgi:hypothetical protein